MKLSLKKLAISATAIGLLTSGAVIVGTSSATAASCGLS
jgi:hypothetical protein